MSEDTLDNEQWDERSKEDMAYDEMIAREEEDPNGEPHQDGANHDGFNHDGEHGQGEDGHFNNEDNQMEEGGEDNDRGGDGEKEDENEFVVWADDADEAGDDDKRSHKASNDQPDGDVKFSVDMVKDKDVISLIWNGEKILVPCKEEILRDLKVYGRQLNIIAYPLLIEDIYNETLAAIIKSAINVSMEMDETSDGLPIKGYLRLRFSTITEVRSATETLKSLSDDDRTINVQNFSENDSEGHILSKVKGKTPSKDSLPERMLFVTNFGSTGEENGGEGDSAMEADLKTIFPDCTRIVLPTKDDRNLGHAYVEFGTDESLNEALEKVKDVLYNGKPLFVIKAINEKKEATGLLKDSLRQYWMEQIKSLEGVDKEKKSAKEISEIDQKLHRYKKRIVTDNAKRQELGIPIPEEEQFQLDPDREEKEKEREKERAARSDAKKRSSSSHKRSPVRARRFSPRRSRGSYRGGSSNYGGSRRGGSNSDELVNQLQHLVGVLSNKLPMDSGRYHDYHERDSRSSFMDSRSRDRYSGDFSDSRRGYDNKRMAPDDYDRDRKRRYDDMDYMRYDRGPEYRNYRGGPRW